MEMLDICFGLSFLILLISGVACTVWNLNIHFKKLSKVPVLNPINVFSIFVFIAFLILFVPNAYEEREKNVILTVLSALFDTMDSLSFGNRIEDMLNRFFEALSPVSEWYVLYACAVTLAVPLLAMRAIFAVFRDWFTQARYRINRRNSFHIFSELNSKSLTAAKDIIEKDENARVVFTSANKKTTDTLYIEQARKINALLTGKTLNSFRLGNSPSDKKLYLYFIGEDNKRNIKLALDKFESIKDSRKETAVIVFSTDSTVEYMVDLANKRNKNNKIRMELFNEAQRTAYNLIYEHPVYDVKTESRNINVMILGAGHLGIELAKAIAWCSQMINRKFNIRVFDKEKKSERHGFPFNGLGKKLKEIGTTLNLEFFACDIFSEEFNSVRFEQADYIVIDVGDDSSNFAAALQMKEIYARQKSHGGYFPSDIPLPKIITIIEDEETKKIVEELKDSAIIPYGNMSSVYSFKNIIDWKLDKAGEFLHACYKSFKFLQAEFKKHSENLPDNLCLINEGIEDYAKQSELDKRSSRAAAIHSKYKIFDTEHSVKQESEGREPISIYKMLCCEHDRWNVFQILDGWEPWDPNNLKEGIHKDGQAKLHAYLAPAGKLKNIAEQAKEAENPVEFDRVMVISASLAFEYAESGIICPKKLDNLFDTFKFYIEADNNPKTETAPEATEEKKEYTPNPVDTSDVILSEDVKMLIEALSVNVHDSWAKKRFDEGWEWGKERNDKLRQHPSLVPYEDLSESEKEYDRTTVQQTVKALLKMGYRFEK